jgi:PAS domain S-box-containing protein
MFGGNLMEIMHNSCELNLEELSEGIAEGLCVCIKIESYPYYTFQLWNSSMISITGYTIDEINTDGLSNTIIRKSYKVKLIDNLLHCITTGKNIVEEEIELTHKSGRRINVIISIRPMEKNSNKYAIVTIKDITRHKKIESSLREYEERYKKLFVFSAEAAFVHDGINIVEANPALSKLLGAATIEELIGQPVMGFIHKDYQDGVKERIKTICEEGGTIPFVEEKMVKKNGDFIDVEVGSVTFPYMGKTQYLVVVRDMSTRKHIENALRDSERILRLVTENTIDMIAITDEYGYFTYVTPSHKKILGIEEKDLLGSTYLDYIHQEDSIYVESQFKSLMRDLKEATFQFRCRHSYGYYVWIEVFAKPLFEDNGAFKGLILCSRDITRRLKAEQALRDSEEMYRWLIESLPYAIYIRKKDKILFCNKIALEYLGVSDFEDIRNKAVEEVIIPHPDYEKEYYGNSLIVKPEEFAAMHEQKFIRLSDGKILNMETVITVFPYEGEESLLIVSRDISEKKRAQELQKVMEEKNKLLNQAIEYEKLRTEFFANISHELRTPINVIFSTLQLLQVFNKSSSNEEEKMDKHIHVMKQNCYRLIRLINNLIDVTKIDAGYLELNLNNYNIVSIVEDITLSVAEYIENKGITLLFDTDTEEKIIACDPDKIERIILNLISNAVKFTEIGGSINIFISDRCDNILISVVDTGVGIPEEKQKLIFERFVQVDKSLARAREGSGIGLSLVKSLVEMHEGKISVKSEAGKGSEFQIELPVRTITSGVDLKVKDNYTTQGNIEKINIEFSDIYF